MGLPITYLESVLKNKSTEQIKIKDEYVSLEELINFWIEQHQMLDKAKEILTGEDKTSTEVQRETKKRSNVSGKKTNKTKLSTGKGKTE